MQVFGAQNAAFFDTCVVRDFFLRFFQSASDFFAVGCKCTYNDADTDADNDADNDAEARMHFHRFAPRSADRPAADEEKNF
jgi:hypothetical protein